jgi:hypothetical protein
MFRNINKNNAARVVIKLGVEQPGCNCISLILMYLIRGMTILQGKFDN